MKQARAEEQPLQVLVVDDSAVVRQIMGAVLSGSGPFDVTTASDPLIAMEKMKRVRPDVIVLDLEMPRMDGLTFLRKLMEEDPIPVVVCSVVAQRGTEAALRALDEGAVDVVAKPEIGVAEFLRDSAVMLADAVYAAAHARVGQLGRTSALPFREIENAEAGADSELRARVASHSVVAIGASTGGPHALTSLLSTLPADAPGCVIVQHMPSHFTSTFARRLNDVCRMEVREARNSEELVQGLALVAPGNRHLLLHRRRRKYVVEVAEGALVSRHRPSVDTLFRSVARAAGLNGMGVILTGMGSDGAKGLREMKKAGAFTFAQDEATSVVFGMPREAIELGGVDEVVSLESLPAAILKRAYSRLTN